MNFCVTEKDEIIINTLSQIYYFKCFDWCIDKKGWDANGSINNKP